MKTFKILLFLPLVGLVPAAAVAQVRTTAPTYAPGPYNWSGFYVGVYGGVNGDSNNPQFQVPTSGTLQGNDIGFAPSSQYNSFGVLSQPYNALSNGVNSGATFSANGAAGTAFNTTVVAPGYTTYGATATSYTYTNPIGAGVPPTNTSFTPYYNAPGNVTNSQLSTTSDSHRLLAAIGGEIGYRKQFGNFVIGVEADGGYIDGKRTQTDSSNGQFSNTQGTTMTATSYECFAPAQPNGGLTCTSAGTQSSNGSVNVENNGNSSFSQSVTAGSQWLGTARMSAGLTFDRLLVYATGGLAYGQASIAGSAYYRDTVTSNCYGNSTSNTSGVNGYGGATGYTSVGYSCNGLANTNTSFTYTDAAQWGGSYQKLMAGYAIGTGAAYALTDNLVLKLEGYYYNLGTLNTTLYGSGTQSLTVNYGGGPIAPLTPPGTTRAASVSSYSVSRKIDGFIAKVSLDLKFDTGTPYTPAPVVAKY